MPFVVVMVTSFLLLNTVTDTFNLTSAHFGALLKLARKFSTSLRETELVQLGVDGHVAVERAR